MRTILLLIVCVQFWALFLVVTRDGPDANLPFAEMRATLKEWGPTIERQVDDFIIAACSDLTGSSCRPHDRSPHRRVARSPRLDGETADRWPSADYEGTGDEAASRESLASGADGSAGHRRPPRPEPHGRGDQERAPADDGRSDQSLAGCRSPATNSVDDALLAAIVNVGQSLEPDLDGTTITYLMRTALVFHDDDWWDDWASSAQRRLVASRGPEGENDVPTRYTTRVGPALISPGQAIETCRTADPRPRICGLGTRAVVASLLTERTAAELAAIRLRTIERDCGSHPPSRGAALEEKALRYLLGCDAYADAQAAGQSSVDPNVQQLVETIVDRAAELAAAPCNRARIASSAR
jgi:hypothetical protein